MFFRKKDKTIGRNTGHTAPAFLRTLDGRPIKYLSRRERATAKERIIGKNGMINVTDDELIILCEGGATPFRSFFNGLTAWELMNLSGVTLEKPDEPDYVYIAYYTYHRK